MELLETQTERNGIEVIKYWGEIRMEIFFHATTTTATTSRVDVEH